MTPTSGPELNLYKNIKAWQIILKLKKTNDKTNHIQALVHNRIIYAYPVTYSNFKSHILQQYMGIQQWYG